MLNVDQLNILDKERWWDIFLTCIRSTVEYTTNFLVVEVDGCAGKC